MKTDIVEIFQTIRALLQPYTTKGFASRTNSETLYDLWSEKQLDINGEKIDLSAFASIEIKDGKAILCIYKEAGTVDCSEIDRLDEDILDGINNNLVKAFATYKQKGWV